VVNTACNGPSGSRPSHTDADTLAPEHSEVGKFDDWWTEARSAESCRCQITGGEISGEGMYFELVIDIIHALGHEGRARVTAAREEGTVNSEVAKVKMIARRLGGGARRCRYAAGGMPALLFLRLGSTRQGPLACSIPVSLQWLRISALLTGRTALQS
jgi:hypothetical protein